ncbi:hypothetical protein BCR43DRAFT_483463 [Syncephalastrum racemosum]|uniref:F-box domain-containing protein n=1 Tax=Syncephalastrum racemosum TaxID=13706 RepID=A0A1X2HWM0_SYNRA|nr:hypothetical protein BCR43DRAFT_483463 [Syncephalastrum racemosum]
MTSDASLGGASAEEGAATTTTAATETTTICTPGLKVAKPYERLSRACLSHIFGYLSRSDQVHAALTCRAWNNVALALVWANFKFLRDREFERVFAIMSRRNASKPYGHFVKALELVHTDKEFNVTPHIILLVTSLCPNLETISITFHHTRPVAPPAPPMAIQNRPVLPPIKRPGEPQARPPHPAQPISPATASPRPLARPLAQPIAALPQQQQQAPRQLHPYQQQQQPSPHAPPQQQQTQQSTRPFNHSLPLAHFAHNCHRLRTIHLTSYSPRTDDSVYEMAKYLRSGTLETVIFTGCATLQGSTLCKLAITNPQLKRLEIMGNTPVSDSSLATIADRCGSHLESLSIGNAHHITDASMKHVARRCKNLRQLCILNNADATRLSETALIDVVRHCRHLQVLSLSNARALSEKFMQEVVDRVEHDLALIENEAQLPSNAGLQRVCLGGVRRDVIQGQSLRQLIHLSASANGEYDDLDNDEDADGDSQGNRSDPLTPSDPLSHLMGNAVHMPKMTVIRASTIWWQRRRAGAAIVH